MSDVIESAHMDVDCEITLEMDATGLCPFDDVVDEYEITIRYTPDCRIVEMQSLAEWIQSYEDREICHEQLCNDIFVELDDELEPESLHVEISPQEYHGIQATVVMGR